MLTVLVAAPAARAQVSDAARQVTIFGIIATPNDPEIDPKLEAVMPQLRKLLPNHGFKLLDVRTRRLVVGQSVGCNLGGGFVASTTLVQPLDENGKVELKCSLLLNMVPQLETLVATPPNQLFFCDKQLPDGTRLLIGVGAR
jgi:hypothetical protein